MFVVVLLVVLLAVFLAMLLGALLPGSRTNAEPAPGERGRQAYEAHEPKNESAS